MKKFFYPITALRCFLLKFIFATAPREAQKFQLAWYYKDTPLLPKFPDLPQDPQEFYKASMEYLDDLNSRTHILLLQEIQRRELVFQKLKVYDTTGYIDLVLSLTPEQLNKEFRDAVQEHSGTNKSENEGEACYYESL